MSKINKIIENGVKSLMIENLEEKAVSKNQQQFMGMVHAYKKGEMKDAPASVKKAAKGMTKKAAKDFASTKHKGLPTKINEGVMSELDIELQDSRTFEEFLANVKSNPKFKSMSVDKPDVQEFLLDLFNQQKGSNENILKEYTDNNFSGAKVISDAKSKKPDSEDMEFIERYFPNAVKSMTKAEQNLRASDNSPIKKRMGQYAPMFVHVQYHTFEGDAGQTYSVHQTQYYNSNFKDQDPSFNPRVTELYFSQKDPDEKMGTILATTDDYIKDLRTLESQGKLGKRISESLKEEDKFYDADKEQDDEDVPNPVDDEGRPLNEGKGLDEASKLIKHLREKVYRNLNDQELEEFTKEMVDHLGGTINEAIDPKYKTFYDEVYKHVNELDRILGANKPPKVPQDVWNTVYGLVGDIADKIDFLETGLQKHLKENKMNAQTESIVKRLKEDDAYQKFFKSAMDKFGIKSPKDLSDKKKKEFFNYVDKNYKAKNESLNEDFFVAHSSDGAEARKVVTQLNNTFKALQDQYRVPTRVLDTAVDLVNQLVEQGYEDGRAEVERML